MPVVYIFVCILGLELVLFGLIMASPYRDKMALGGYVSHAKDHENDFDKPAE